MERDESENHMMMKKNKPKHPNKAGKPCGTNRECSWVELVLSWLLDIPTTIKIKWGFLLLLACIGGWLWYLATKQYSPEIHRIHVESDGLGCADALTVYTSLFYTECDEDDVKYGKQWLDFQASGSSIKEVSSVPPEVEAVMPGDYTHCVKTTLTVSGEDFTNEVSVNQWGDWSNSLFISGPARYDLSEDGHSLTLENYKTDSNAKVEYMIYGTDIFSDVTSDNPYIAFDMSFEGIHLKEGAIGHLNFVYSRDTTKYDYSFHHPAPLQVISVYPEPDFVTPDSFSFESNLDEILEHGLYIILEDLSKKRENDRTMFICSVFLGVVVSFFVQLVISLIKDIRDNKRRERLEIKKGA